METYNCLIENRNCYCAISDPSDLTTGTIIYYPGGARERSMFSSVIQNLAESEAKKNTPFVLVGFESDDWDTDFSPWPAPAVYKNDTDFTGGASRTLRWLRDSCIPQLENNLGLEQPRRGIIGYSLAGLFALWSMYETDLFQLCGCCSGSLWYPGWIEYMRTHQPHDHIEKIYLSLGDREEYTKNRVVAQVGDRTRETISLLQEQLADTSKITFVQNTGGHFNQVPERIGSGLRWLV